LPKISALGYNEKKRFGASGETLPPEHKTLFFFDKQQGGKI